jgi:Do/DeqQ family serine protease
MMNVWGRVALCVVVSMGTSCWSQPGGEQSPVSAASKAAPRTSGVVSYADVVSRVSPAVVTIWSERRSRAPQIPPFLRNNPMLREFFGREFGEGQQEPPARRQRGLGSGVIVSADGYILTNHHVVDGAEDIQVEQTGGGRKPAKLVGSDPPSDLALLKIEASGLPVLTLGNSDDVRVGDVVLAIGNPLGIGQTVTAGIISATNRTTGLGDGSYEDFLQTDAPINQGNSGGALVSTNGELIGINSQILSTSGGSIGIGFAIPSNMARSVMDQLRSGGKVTRSQLGVGIQPVTPDIASGLGLKEARGVLINSVTPGSPAEKAGLKRGDVILQLNGQAVSETNALRNQIASSKPGTQVTLRILRDGREQDIRVTLGEMVSEASAQEPGQSRGGSTGGRLGVAVEPVTPETAAQLGIPRETQGLLVRQVQPDGVAAEAGIAPGDILVEANRQPLRAVTDLENAIRAAADKPVLLLVNRRGQTIYVPVRPRAAQ